MQFAFDHLSKLFLLKLEELMLDIEAVRALMAEEDFIHDQCALDNFVSDIPLSYLLIMQFL